MRILITGGTGTLGTHVAATATAEAELGAVTWPAYLAAVLGEGA